MDDYMCTVHVCDNPQAIEATEEGLVTLLERLGRNILNHLGRVELGHSIRLFLRDPVGKVVGGAIGDLFGGWLFITLFRVGESLRNQGLGTEIMNRPEQRLWDLWYRRWLPASGRG